jgi:membrane-associated phospholipid phosphatase
MTLIGAFLFWSIAAAALWLGGIAVCPGGACHVLEFDRWVLGALHAVQQPELDTFFRAATWLGSISVLFPAALALAWWFQRRGQPAAAVLLPLAVGGAWLLAHVGKLLIVRPRPELYPALIEMPADLSFPSAHAMQITAFALTCVLAPGTQPGWVGLAGATLLVLLVALSRLYLQVHFPSDILIGLIVGTGWAAGLRLLLRRAA